MDLAELVTALRQGNALRARQWVADSRRAALRWEDQRQPPNLDATDLAIAAGVAELLAHRTGQAPPTWTASVPPAPHPFFLVRSAAVLPRLRRLCETEGPEPLRKRGLLAPPEFLTSV